eukprot:TRINITY_DN70811_c2_g1_i1.p2 TRINITY_DN70811_c2_g1~~TRINITY_DN70811_c2_g1_i1.p2  ORF type:complete len:900 (+),score=54.88 TRINITY_DN70811_c2_g1_i1:3575-6274(+)
MEKHNLKGNISISSKLISPSNKFAIGSPKFKPSHSSMQLNLYSGPIGRLFGQQIIGVRHKKVVSDVPTKFSKVSNICARLKLSQNTSKNTSASAVKCSSPVPKSTSDIKEKLFFLKNAVRESSKEKTKSSNYSRLGKNVQTPQHHYKKPITTPVSKLHSKAPSVTSLHAPLSLNVSKGKLLNKEPRSNPNSPKAGAPKLSLSPPPTKPGTASPTHKKVPTKGPSNSSPTSAAKKTVILRAKQVTTPTNTKCKYSLYFIFQIDVSYKDLFCKIKKPFSFVPLTMSSIPGYSSSKTEIKTEVKKKLNKLEQAREKLISWITDCIKGLQQPVLDKKRRKEHPKTTIDFYVIGRVLGKGAFGKVNLCVHKLSGKLVAIKSLNKQYLASEGNNVKFKNEIALLRLLKHKNIMRLYETFSTDSYLLIVMELCSGGDLLTYVRKRRRVAEPVAKVIFKEILEGLSHCHSKGIVHRDIKLDNILLDEYGHVKIGDFGVSKRTMKGKKLYDRCGTPAYIAPEILKDAGYEGEKVDVWSAGVVLYAMIYGNFPFKATSVNELEKIIISGKYTLPEDVSEEVRDLLRQILQPDPSLRISIEEVFNHLWLQDVDPSQPIFAAEEIENIMNEYRFKSQDKDSSDSSANSSVFTEHKLDTAENESENDLSKSTVLAPFNSVEQDAGQFFESIVNEIVPKKMLKFSSKLREYDRKYERDNNSQLDNGVYVQPIGGASPKGYQQNKPSMSTSTPSTPGQISPKSSEKTLMIKAEERKTGAKTTQSYYGKEGVDYAVLGKMEKMGFEKGYIVASLGSNELNSATTLYYLLTNYQSTIVFAYTQQLLLLLLLQREGNMCLLTHIYSLILLQNNIIAQARPLWVQPEKRKQNRKEAWLLRNQDFQVNVCKAEPVPIHI